jgi:hypothetical protein
MDVLKTAAGNEGLSGLLMQSGLGTGMGLMMGAQMGQQAGNMMTQVPPLSSQVVQFYVVINGQQAGPFSVEVLQQMISAGTFNAASMVWRQGLTGWQLASSVTELMSLFATNVNPPPVPKS